MSGGKEQFYKQLIENIDRNGDFIIGDDGYKHFFPSGRGYLTAECLRAIADELDKRNAEWDAQVKADFKLFYEETVSERLGK